MVNFDRNKLGINGLMKPYQGKPGFEGGWDEDFENCIGVNDKFSKMYMVTE